MKRWFIIICLAVFAMSCGQNVKEAKMQIIKGDTHVYGILDSALFLATKDTTEFDIKLYQGDQGLMLESPKPLYGKLFGVKSSTGFSDRLKYDFEYLGMKKDKYLYGIAYSSFPSFWGAYYLQNFEYCWIFYKYDDFSNKPDMIEFSKEEFDKYFYKVKASIIN